MYNEYFGFKEAPFSIAPDPRYLYMSDQHREAFAHLLYGIRSEGGFVLFTGEVGTGKTTICRCLLEQLPEDCDVAFIFNPRMNVEELLSTICDELRISYPPGTTSNKTLVDLLNRHLLEAHAAGRKTVLIIDEAQNLSAAVLEQMRLLTNLETNQRKLLQIIMLGQPELQTLLARPELRQLGQRIIARCHLGSLSKPEMAAYVQHRLAVAGCQRQLFSPAALNRLYRLSGGIPRLINVLCDRALLGVYAGGKERVDRATLATAAREVFGEARWNRRRVWRMARNGVLGLVLLGTGAFLASLYYNPKMILLFNHVLEKPIGNPTDNFPAYRKSIPSHVEKPIPKRQTLQTAPVQKTVPASPKAVPKPPPVPVSQLQSPAGEPIGNGEALAAAVNEQRNS